MDARVIFPFRENQFFRWSDPQPIRSVAVNDLQVACTPHKFFGGEDRQVIARIYFWWIIAFVRPCQPSIGQCSRWRFGRGEDGCWE
jgi:hypothetical protein